MKPAPAIGFALRRGARGLRRRSRASAWAALAVAAAVFVVGAVRVIERNVDGVVARWPGGVDAVVYLEDGVDPAGAATLAAALRRLPGVEQVEVVPAAAALERLRLALGDQGRLLDGVEPGLVPASLEVGLSPGVAEVASAHPVLERLRATPGVDEVEFVGDWVEHARALAAGLRRGGALAALVAGLLAALTIAGVIRLAVAGRRREARLLDVLGATTIFVRGPAIVHGALIALCGAGVAGAALALAYRPLAAAAGAVLDGALGAVDLGFLPPGELAALALAAAALGAVGGALAGPRVARG